MFFLLVLLVGDSALFQSEIIYLLHPASERIEFPAIKLSTQLERSDQISSDVMLKYQAWTKAPGVEYQLVDSSTMQWDPLLTRFRVDLFPANVKKVMDILIRSDTNDFVAICKPKFRLLNQSIRVPSDDQGLALLESQTGWDTKVLLTGAGNDEPPSLNPALESEHSTLNVDNFSANSLSLSISNSFPDPAWLVYSDAYTPGWHAIVNGTPAPVVEAYTAFKAVRLAQSGNNTVRFFYDTGLPLDLPHSIRCPCRLRRGNRSCRARLAGSQGTVCRLSAAPSGRTAFPFRRIHLAEDPLQRQTRLKN